MALAQVSRSMQAAARHGDMSGAPEETAPGGESADNWPDWNSDCTQWGAALDS